MTGATPIGIHDLRVATGAHVVELSELADTQGIDPNKFLVGLGQQQFSMPAHDEDIVTMAAAATAPLIEKHGLDGIRTIFFATESGVDQSKSAGAFLHALLGLPTGIRVVELKQACYGATAGLQAAIGLIARDPRERVLVIASDVARYDLDSAGEPTQGAGAVAMLISADPALIEIEAPAGIHTTDIDDFWRPNDRSTALVDGKLSIQAYLASLTGSFDDYRARGGAEADTLASVLMHQPFTKMAAKGIKALSAHTGVELPDITPTMEYNRRMGNSYTASIFVALVSLLDADAELAGRRIGFYSYGSGSIGEFFSGIVQPGYRELRAAEDVPAMLAAREPLAIADYRELHETTEFASDRDIVLPVTTSAPFRLAGVTGGARDYTATAV